MWFSFLKENEMANSLRDIRKIDRYESAHVCWDFPVTSTLA